mmetsp:Transcript_14528/g.41371  ORF Transcript_14528/g.41371 Transcript_14528/m.41371 type:complete len:252 (-) Transcript_14528:12-767(-)
MLVFYMTVGNSGTNRVSVVVGLSFQNAPGPIQLLAQNHIGHSMIQDTAAQPYGLIRCTPHLIRPAERPADQKVHGRAAARRHQLQHVGERLGRGVLPPLIQAYRIHAWRFRLLQHRQHTLALLGLGKLRVLDPRRVGPERHLLHVHVPRELVQPLVGVHDGGVFLLVGCHGDHGDRDRANGAILLGCGDRCASAYWRRVPAGFGGCHPGGQAPRGACHSMMYACNRPARRGKAQCMSTKRVAAHHFPPWKS